MPGVMVDGDDLHTWLVDLLGVQVNAWTQVRSKPENSVSRLQTSGGTLAYLKRGIGLEGERDRLCGCVAGYPYRRFWDGSREATRISCCSRLSLVWTSRNPRCWQNPKLLCASAVFSVNSRAEMVE